MSSNERVAELQSKLRDRMTRFEFVIFAYLSYVGVFRYYSLSAEERLQELKKKLDARLRRSINVVVDVQFNSLDTIR